jgi:maleylacetoacetate isomerase
MRFYTYFRSGTAHRTRIALNLKGIAPEPVYIDLLKGDQRQESYRSRNPEGLLPLLEVDGARISQSLAIIEYLDQIHPEPPLLPQDPLAAARVRSLALVCACDIHPLTNLRVLKFLKRSLNVDDEGRERWARHWLEEGLGVLERRLSTEPETAAFAHGDRPSLADVCLVPQVVGARRWNVDLAPFPTVRRIYDTCLKIDAFAQAMPARQSDADEAAPAG